MTAQCDYCGKPGCQWQRHPQAWADVAADKRRQQAEEFPFGDYREEWVE